MRRIAAVCMLLCASVGAHASVIVSWDAASGLKPDEIAIPYTLGTTGAAPAPVLAAGALTIGPTASDTDNVFYRHDDTQVDFVGAHNIRFNMRSVSSASGFTHRAGAGVTFATATSVGQSLFIDTNEVFFITAAGRSAPAAIDTTVARDYHIEISGTAAGSTVELFVDGAATALLSDVLFADVPNFGTTERVLFGEFSSAATGESVWTSFVHDAGIASTVPAPSTIALMLLGLLPALRKRS